MPVGGHGHKRASLRWGLARPSPQNSASLVGSSSVFATVTFAFLASQWTLYPLASGQRKRAATADGRVANVLGKVTEVAPSQTEGTPATC